MFFCVLILGKRGAGKSTIVRKILKYATNVKKTKIHIFWTTINWDILYKDIQKLYPNTELHQNIIENGENILLNLINELLDYYENVNGNGKTQALTLDEEIWELINGKGKEETEKKSKYQYVDHIFI